MWIKGRVDLIGLEQQICARFETFRFIFKTESKLQMSIKQATGFLEVGKNVFKVVTFSYSSNYRRNFN